MLPYADYIRRLSRIRTERGAKQIVQKGSGFGAIFTSLLTPIILEIAKNLAKNNGK
jgi:hypothetical protein